MRTFHVFNSSNTFMHEGLAINLSESNPTLEIIRTEEVPDFMHMPILK